MSQAAQVISLRTSFTGTPILNERLAGAAGILPGHLVQETGTADVIVHGTAAVNAQRLFAQSNIANGGTIDTAYADNETVSYGAYHSGQEVNALVAASAAAIVVDDPLESAGDGTLRKAVADAATDTVQRDSIVAYAIVDVDNSGGGTVVRIKTRIA